jgi:BASS family bile acid:Na+ symporter
MPILKALAAALAWLGRQGTRALAVSIFLGLAVPQLAAYVKPYLGETVFVLLLFSYLRTDPPALLRHVRSPVLAIGAALWVMLAVPLFFGAAYAFSGLRTGFPDLYTIMVLQIVIAPITSSAAFAAIMALDVEFTLLTLILCSVLSPITTVAFSYLFLGASLFSPIDLGIKIFFFYAGSGAVAFAIRRIVGQNWIERRKDHIDGLNVIAVFVFAIVAMESVPRHVMADPLFATALLGLILLLSCLLIGVSMLVFLRAGAGAGMVIGMLASFRNIGLVMATLGAILPDTAWFYFGLVQFPIYLFPLALKPLAGRFAPRAVNGSG